MQSITIVTPFPPAGKYSHKKSALASFSYNLVDGIKKVNPEAKIHIFADKITGDSHADLKNVTVHRTWKKNNPFVLVKLFNTLRKHSNKKILFQFEWNLFGNGFLYLIQFPFFLLFLKLVGKQTYVVSHGVITDFSQLEHTTALPKGLMNFFAQNFYRLLAAFSTQIIVLEEYLKERLKRIGISGDKVAVIPHGVDTDLVMIDKAEARKKLGIDPATRMIVYFGFLVEYKGPDVLLDAFLEYKKQSGDKKTQLFFVGGESFNLTQNPLYRKFVDNFYSKAGTDSTNVHITGYIEEDKIPLYLSSADLMVFPYRMLLSSSGPLSLAYSFEKPMLLSHALQNYAKTEDIKQSLEESKVSLDEIVFHNTSENFAQKMSDFPENSKKITHFSKLMRMKRSWDKIAAKYIDLLS